MVVLVELTNNLIVILYYSKLIKLSVYSGNTIIDPLQLHHSQDLNSRKKVHICKWLLIVVLLATYRNGY